MMLIINCCSRIDNKTTSLSLSLFLFPYLVQSTSGRSSRNDSLQIIPSSTHTASMLLQQVLQGNTHLLLHHTGVVHMAADGEQFHSVVVLAAQAVEPLGTTTENARGHRHSFAVGDGGGTAVETGSSGEWRLQTRFALLALQGFQLGTLFSAHVGSSSAVDEDIKVVARSTSIATDETRNENDLPKQ